MQFITFTKIIFINFTMFDLFTNVVNEAISLIVFVATTSVSITIRIERTMKLTTKVVQNKEIK